MRLVHEKEIQKTIEPCREELLGDILEILPFAKIEEIGSTAIPGATTKGDLDLLVIVPDEAFEPAKERVLKKYEKNDMEAIAYFESFKGNS